MSSEKKAPNKLIHEKSPYLLQHAHNPVNWYPWGAEAFERAQQEDKPIFLSIGYATCHWCHVMERESFEDEEVAALLNEHFVSIKVDREERPDIDHIYMTVCQAFTGQGGWPLTIVMTPSQKPFYAATYLPKESQGPYTGMMELLPILNELWHTDRNRVEKQGEATAHFLNEQAKERPKSHEPDTALLRRAAAQLGRSFDAQYGGFSGAPKFPMPHTLLLLLRYARLQGDNNALQMAQETLRHMYRGGMFDHIGGGFSRYSTDRRWLVPHFEKMLYDNALLLWAYLEAYEDTGNEIYRYVAEHTFTYALRELKAQTGGFFCGQDADSEGVEGKYYLFTPQDVESTLPGHAQRLCEHFGITESGNFEGGNIPNLLHHREAPVPDKALIEDMQRLLSLRRTRIPPATDDKLLTAWNALMIIALARGYRALGKKEYHDAAIAAKDCVETYLSKPTGDLFVRYRDGRADHDGQLADYAFYGYALLELYAVCGDVALLKRACYLARRMAELFGDKENGFYLYSSETEQLIARPKETYDGAMPSGNSAAALLLMRLSRLTGEEYFRKQAQRQLGFIASHAAQAPSGHSFGLLAVAEYVYPTTELVIVSGEEQDWSKVLRELSSHGATTAAIVKTPSSAADLNEIAPFTAAYPFPKSGSAYYVCKNGACSAPVYEKDACMELLKQ